MKQINKKNNLINVIIKSILNIILQKFINNNEFYIYIDKLIERFEIVFFC